MQGVGHTLQGVGFTAVAKQCAFKSQEWDRDAWYPRARTDKLVSGETSLFQSCNFGGYTNALILLV